MDSKGVKTMYQIGEYVVKANNGVCSVDDIVHLNMSGVDKKKEYYLLVPIEDKGAKIYVPVDKAQENLREVLSSEAAWDLIRGIPQIESIWITNDKLREQEYKAAIKSGRPEALVGIIKNLYDRREARMAEGKKSTAVDERYFRLAENMLYSELAFAIGKEKEDMGDIIKEVIENGIGE